MIDELRQLIDTYGHVPNGNRTYYLSRSQPPFFFEMVGPARPDARRCLRAVPARTEGANTPSGWRARRTLEGGRRASPCGVPDDGSLLNRYWDERDTPRDESIARTSMLAAAARGARSSFTAISARRPRAAGISARAGSPMPGHSRRSRRPRSCPSISTAFCSVWRRDPRGLRRARDHACAHDFEKRAAARRAR